MTFIWRKSILFSSQTLTFFNCVRNKTMKAWQAFEYGGIDKLQLNHQVQMPVLSNNLDVLVKVSGASINPLDIKMLEGYGANTFNFIHQLNSCSINPPEFPLVVGRDFSGTVVHVGKKVKSFKIGDEVWGTLSPWENGSFSEYILASACNITKKPKSLNHLEASSFPYAALTAWSALSIFGQLSEKSAYNKRILITGASGGVGTFAVQLLKTWGADVTVTCSEDATEMLYNLGADSVLIYQSPDFKYNLKEMKRFDLIFDNVGKDYPEMGVGLLKQWENSKYVTVVSPVLQNIDDRGLLIGTFMSSIQATFDTIESLKDGKSFRWAYFIPNSCALKKIAQMIDNSQIKPVIDKIYKFEELEHALTEFSSGHSRGKSVIDFILEDRIPDAKQSISNNKKQSL